MFTIKPISVGLVTVLAAQAALFNTRDLIEQALDEPTTIHLEQVRLDEAIGVVSAQTGVRLVMDAQVMRLTPHGPETVLERVDLAGLPLREGLRRLLAPLAMEFTVQDDHVAIVPSAALRCLGRAPTWPELDLINELQSRPLGTDDTTLNWLGERVQFRVPAPNAWPVLMASLRGVGVGSVAETLSVATSNLGWAWCVDGDRVIVESVPDQLRRQLAQPVSLRMNNRPLVDVLSALGREIGVNVRSEPGALASLPQSVQRNFSLNVVRQSAEDALEQIAAFTGLGYLIDPQGVLFYRADRIVGGANSAADALPAPTPGSVPAPPGSDPYVGKVVISLDDGTTLEWLVRRSELPPDLQARRDTDLRRAFDLIRSK